ncbi:MAG: hypothetical protein ACKVXR_04125 [Planctomycetota bacterium]
MSDSSHSSFLLAVDDGGEYFVASSDSLVIGHLSSSSADLPFLADVEAIHARLALRESFHSGPRWTLAALGSARILVAGQFVGPEPALLGDGDLVHLAPNLSFRFRAPDPSSSAAVLDLLSGADCKGARHVLLFPSGPGGRVRIGPRLDRHITVSDLLREVTLEIEDAALLVRCAGGVRVQGGAGSQGPDPALSLPCPPTRSISVSVAARAADRPPFGITVWPARMVAPNPARPRPA